jgi:AraC family transcriptional regulator, carnitine catabolism transcriptional activator
MLNPAAAHRRHGTRLAVDVSEQLIHDRLRSRSDQQRMTLARRLGSHNRRLVQAVALMERHLETPLSLAEIASRCGVTPRQMQRLFEQHLASTPHRWYLGLRLERAHRLLTETDLGVLSVGLACGFNSAPSFSRAFREHYGRPPREVRRQPLP